MSIEIYRKRRVFNAYVIDEKPDCIIRNVTNLEITPRAFLGVSDGRQIRVSIDRMNYHYIIAKEV